MASAVLEYDRVSAAKFVDYKFFVPPLPAPHQLQKTVFLHCDPDGRPYKFDDMVGEFERLSLMEKLGGCGQYQRNHMWEVCLKDADHLQPLLDAGELTVKGRRCVVIDPCFRRVHFILHWVPAEVGDRAVRRVVRQFGSVDHMLSEGVGAAEKWRSVWARVTLRDGLTVDDVPHLLRLRPGSTSLVVIVGREPLCLRCHQRGHLRRSCGAERCGLCARVGHADADCPRKPAEAGKGKAAAKSRSSSRKGKKKKKKKR